MIKSIFFCVLILFCGIRFEAFSQNYISGLEDLKKPTGEWFEAGGAKLDGSNEKLLESIPGEGVLLNGKKGRTAHFITSDEYGDNKLYLEFMVAKGSNSGVYLQGRYEVQILDSYGKDKVVSGDCGGIYQRWDENRVGDKGYDGIPPMVNASKPPGEWQTLFVHFKAPRFNKKGEKKRNARFKKVELNGIVVHKNVEATGPTRSSLDNFEKPFGPLMLQGDHGPVAYRKIKIKK